jgi:hypothetical protein
VLTAQNTQNDAVRKESFALAPMLQWPGEGKVGMRLPERGNAILPAQRDHLKRTHSPSATEWRAATVCRCQAGPQAVPQTEGTDP